MKQPPGNLDIGISALALKYKYCLLDNISLL